MSSAFKTLSLGVGSFDKNRFQSQVDLFNRHEKRTAQPDVEGSGASTSAATALPAELDFFGQSAKAGNAKAKGKQKATNASTTDEDTAAALSKKKRKRGNQEDDPSTPSLTPSTVKPYLKQHRLNITGTDYPLPLITWSESRKRYSVQDWLVEEMESRQWSLTGVQRAALPVSFEKRDLLAMAPTGSGKTMAYLLPMIHHLLSTPDKNKSSHGPRALILSPTRELATQIYNEARRLLLSFPGSKKSLRVALLTGKQRLSEQQTDASKAPKGGKGRKFDLLISTPLRLVNAVEVEGWDLSNVSQVVLDEADTLLSEAFLAQTDQLLSLCTSKHLQKSLFSATLPSSIETLSKTFLSPDHVRLIVGSSNSSSSDVFQEIKFCGNEEGKLMELRSMIKTGGLKPPTLLFVQSIERAKDLYEELIYDGLRLDVIHSDRNRREREHVISSFKRGDIWLLICTEVLSRGLDFKGVELVINYDFPTSVESYIHRIGRTGRAGRRGSAVTFFTKEDAPYLRSVLNLIKASNPDATSRLPEYLLNLPKVAKKEKKRLKRNTVQRQAVGEASGSRKAEIDAKERREGKRVRKSQASDSEDNDSDDDGDESD